MTNFNNSFGSYSYGNLYQPQNNYNNMMNNHAQANNYYYVNGVIGAKSFQLQPNQTVMLMDSDNPMCYMKQSNGMGQSTLRYFKLVEVNESDLNPAPKVNQSNNEYVLKSDFEGLLKRVDELSSVIQKTQNNEKEVVNNG